MKIIIVLLIGIAVFLLLKALNATNNYFAKQFAKWTQKINLAPAVEFIVWLIFIFWSIDFLFKNKLYYQYLVISIVIIVVIFLAWFVVKDFIAGIVFKVQNDLQFNSHIQLGKITGTIKSQHLTHLKVETSLGQVVKIPYSRLNQEVISEILDSSMVEEFKFQVQSGKGKSKQEIEDMIEFLVINSPWSSSNSSPIIKLISEKEDKFTFEVQVNTLNHKHMRQLEKSITAQLLAD
ncbi:MAG: mechanosensitive ion channel [Bacteroidales bacterium]|nr:mechanosensitive ion channel [Bacteroidales bacterium]MCF8405911.1 mechanosensitive ion channel [Bacteroidales bacterium]